MAKPISHRGPSKAPRRLTRAQADYAIAREVGLVKAAPKKPKPKPQVPAKAAGAVASSPSTVSLEDAVAKLRAALRR